MVRSILGVAILLMAYMFDVARIVAQERPLTPPSMRLVEAFRQKGIEGPAELVGDYVCQCEPVEETYASDLVVLARRSDAVARVRLNRNIQSYLTPDRSSIVT